MRALDMHLLQELVRLHRLGLSNRVIAKRLGISRTTERKYRAPLSAAGLLEGDPAALPELADIKAVIAIEHGDDDTPATKPSSIEDWADDIADLLEAGAGPTAIYDRLRLDERFEGSIGAVKRLCLRLRKAKGISADDVAIPVETAAGEVAQVDFGYVGQLYDPDEGRMRKAWIFVMVLGFSRLMVVRIVFDQKIETWCAATPRPGLAFGSRTILSHCCAGLPAAEARPGTLRRRPAILNAAPLVESLRVSITHPEHAQLFRDGNQYRASLRSCVL